MSTSEVNGVAHALERLRERGWCKYVYRASDGRMCILGALNSTNASYLDRYAVEKIIAEQFPELNSCNIQTFNDQPDRCFEDVERVLEKAALERETALSPTHPPVGSISSSTGETET